MKLLKVLTYGLILILVALTCSGCSTETSGEIKQDMPADFNFKVSYGTYGKQKIDTFNGVVVKDLVEDGTIKADIALNENEMRQIFKEMVDMDIMDGIKLEEFEECATEPASYTGWTIQMNGETKTFDFSTFCENSTEIRDLIELEEFIHEIVLAKNEYKELPEANGSYE